MRTIWLFVLVLLAAPLAAQPQPEAPNAEAANRAIAQLRSPYCPGLMLEVCPSPQAAALRDSIHDLAAEGMGEAELVEWMIARHGEEWRGVPQRSGRGLWAWIIPPAFLLLGAGVLLARLRATRDEAAPAPEPAEALSEQERARLAAALREWEQDDEVDG